jgi:hypothetical protein
VIADFDGADMDWALLWVIVCVGEVFTLPHMFWSALIGAEWTLISADQRWAKFSSAK